jgi:hypothetical protein
VEIHQLLWEYYFQEITQRNWPSDEEVQPEKVSGNGNGFHHFQRKNGTHDGSKPEFN